MFFLPLCLWSAALSPFRCPMYERRCCSSPHSHIHASGCYYLTSTPFHSCAYAMAAASLQFLFSSFRRLYRYMFFLPLCPWSASLSLFHCPMYGRLCRSFLRRNIHASGCCCQTSTPFRSCVYAIPAASLQFLFSSFRRLYRCMFFLPLCLWSAALSPFRCPMYERRCCSSPHSHIHASGCYYLTSTPFHSCAYAMAAASLQFLFSSFRRLYRYMFFLPLCPWSASLSLFHCPMYGRLCRSFLRRNIHASGCCCQTSTPFRSCVYAIPAAFQQFPFSSCHRLYK